MVSEGLDRLSRDQEDIAGFYKQLSFAGVKLVPLAEGEARPKRGRADTRVGLGSVLNWR